MVPQELSRVTLIAVSVLVFAQVLRATFPGLGGLSEPSATSSVTTTTTVGLLVALAGFAAPLLRSRAGGRGLLIAGVGGLLAVRLAMQVVSPQLWLGLVGIALGTLAVVALYETARGLSGVGFAVAVVAGLAADTTVRLVSGTWDPVWYQGVWPWLSCLGVVGVGVVALVGQLRSAPVPPPGISWRDGLGAAALGPFLALQVLVLSSPAFTASAAGLTLPLAGAVVLAGQAFALAFLASGLAVRAVPGGVCVLGGTVLGVAMGAITGPYGLSGRFVPGVVMAGQVLAAALLAVACRAPLRAAGTGGSVVRIDLGAAFGGFLIAAVLVPYQLDYEIPGKVIPGAAAIGLGGLAAIAAARGGPLPARSGLRALSAGAAGLALLVVPLGLTFTGDPRPVVSSGDFRMVTYNIRGAVDQEGRLDPESVARAIEAQRADVVLLQEVSRGGLDAGTTDVGEWLARRLNMRMVWGPADDGQFGNAVLTRLPVRASGTARLPRSGGPKIRGYVWARLDMGDGRTADVWSVHLQPGADQAGTRLAEIGALLKAWSGAPRTIIAAAMEVRPGSPELDRFVAQTGLRVAREARLASLGAGDAILATDDLGVSDVAVDNSSVPGHLPVAATVRVIG